MVSDAILLTTLYDIQTLGHNGLGVIGGNTVNFVGLGGCLPESPSFLNHRVFDTRS